MLGRHTAYVVLMSNCSSRTPDTVFSCTLHLGAQHCTWLEILTAMALCWHERVLAITSPSILSWRVMLAISHSCRTHMAGVASFSHLCLIEEGRVE